MHLSSTIGMSSASIRFEMPKGKGGLPLIKRFRTHEFGGMESGSVHFERRYECGDYATTNEIKLTQVC